MSAGQSAGLGLLAVILAALPFVLDNPYHFEIAILVCLNATVCVGLNLLIGYAGQISLGHAGFFALGGYASAILTLSYDWPPLGALAAGALGVAVLAHVVARPILQLKGHYLAMGTLGLGVIISIALNREVELTGGPDGTIVPPFSVLGWMPFESLEWYAITAGLMFVTVWLSLNLIGSPIGRALRALHGSEVAAETLGVNTASHKNLLFVASAVLAAVCGSLYAHFSGFITPTEGAFHHSIELVTMVVLGGMASVFGAVVGAALLTIAPQVLTVFHDYESIVFGAVLMGMMIVLPRGLVPGLVRLVQSVGFGR